MNATLRRLFPVPVSWLGWLVTRRGAVLEQVVRGGIWLLLGDAFTRVAGVAKIAILARLLAPSDFGVMAIATAMLKGLEYLTETGFSAALIHKRDDIRGHLGTVWSVQIVRTVVLSGTLAAAAPLGGRFFAMPEATAVIRAVALVLLLRGLANPAIVMLRKDLDFQRLVLYRFASVVIGIAVGIAWAIVDPSVWALVASALAAQAAETVGSFWVVRDRPRLEFDIAHARELIVYGKWMFWANVLAFIGVYGDTIAVARVLGAGALGLYQMAYYPAMLPFTVVGTQIRGVMFPAFSKIADPAEQRRTLLTVLGLTGAVVIPVAAFVTVFADMLVGLLLGPRWLAIAPPLRILVWGAGAATVSALLGSLLQARGRPDLVVKFALVQITVWAVSFYPLLTAWGIEGMATATTTGCVIAALAKLVFATRLLGIRAPVMLRTLSVPMAASLPFAIAAPVALALPPSTAWLLPLAAGGVLAYAAILGVAMRSHLAVWARRSRAQGSAA
jgi:O-antigen/teichoic acid export membrane protein